MRIMKSVQGSIDLSSRLQRVSASNLIADEKAGSQRVRNIRVRHRQGRIWKGFEKDRGELSRDACGEAGTYMHGYGNVPYLRKYSLG